MEVFEFLADIIELVADVADSDGRTKLREEWEKEELEQHLVKTYSYQLNMDLSESEDILNKSKNKIRDDDRQKVVPSISKSGVKHVENAKSEVEKTNLEKLRLEEYKKEKARRDAKMAQIKGLRNTKGTPTISLSGVSYGADAKKTVVSSKTTPTVSLSGVSYGADTKKIIVSSEATPKDTKVVKEVSATKVNEEPKIEEVVLETKEDIKPIEKESEYNERGFNSMGYHRNGTRRDDDGFDSEGYSLFGYDKDGFDRNGYNHLGYDRFGYNKDGYDHDGYNKDGIDRFGGKRQK